ncbi:hypothetical protein [Clostridium beijerinckii]|uniref:hypothetical protein n=1 Tax=Clostridium beijerinckii TaxID=1520 RepID=UPI0022E6E73A|nr:hypothetical protein [Clostridium beijerinckii]
MIIFHKAKKQIGLIASLLVQSVDEACWKMGAYEKSSYAATRTFLGRWTCYFFDYA